MLLDRGHELAVLDPLLADVRTGDSRALVVSGSSVLPGSKRSRNWPSPPCSRSAPMLDEMELHVVPVLLGRGRQLFNHLPAGHIELEPTRRLSAPDVDPARQVLHLRYRIQRPGARGESGRHARD
jgi:hypothetical protein